MVKVTLHKRVKIGDRDAHCYREAEMPAVSAGMYVSEDMGNDPVEIEQVVFSMRTGVLYVSLDGMDYGNEFDGAPEQEESQWQFETSGWEIEPVSKFGEWPRWYDDYRNPRSWPAPAAPNGE